MKFSMKARELAYPALGTALIAVCAWISIPTMVPFTLQTFAICLVSALLGLRMGLLAMGGYLLLGAVGVPVFAGYKGGVAALLGPTGGYLIGFLFIALVVGLAVDKLGRKLPVLILSMVGGILLCYAFGTAWFIRVYSRNSGPIGIGAALGWCVLPYLIPDGLKVALAAFLTGRLEPLIRKGSM